jgi:hypothetical protein
MNAEQLTEPANAVEALASIEHDEQRKTYYILIDRLDENWVDASLRFKLIRGRISQSISQNPGFENSCGHSIRRA